MIFRGKYHVSFIYQCIYYFCAERTFDTLDENYFNDFSSLKPDKKDNVGFDVLITYLISKFGFSNETVLEILNNYDTKEKQVLNRTQFMKMMKNMQHFQTSEEKKSKNIFDLYDLDNNYYINRHELLGDNLISSLRIPLETLLILINLTSP